MAFTAETIRNDNICVIWVDDMIDVFTWRDTFGIRIQTPNLDRLLNNGVRFGNAYATIPLCAPCRAELATGLSPFRTGLVDLNRFWRQYGLSFYFQRYKGFYVASPWTELDVHKPDRYPQLPDAAIFTYGVNFYYVIEPENYSLSAAFSQTEFQAFSGGSWLLTGFYNHLDLERGNRFLPGSDPNSMQSLPNLESSSLDTVGGGFGYGHTWVQERRFIAAQALIGAGPQLQKIGESNGDLLRDMSPAGKFNFSSSAGYNLKTFTYGVKFVLDSLFSNVKGVQVSSSLVLGQIFFGGRF